MTTILCVLGYSQCFVSTFHTSFVVREHAQCPETGFRFHYSSIEMILQLAKLAGIEGLEFE